jgi:hypothetical protein
MRAARPAVDRLMFVGERGVRTVSPEHVGRSLSGARAPRFAPSITTVLPRGHPPNRSISLYLVTPDEIARGLALLCDSLPRRCQRTSFLLLELHPRLAVRSRGNAGARYGGF